MTAAGPIRIGTRGSTLATTQSRQVAEMLTAATGRPCELVIIRTRGDTDTAPLTQIGGTGVFVTAVRSALLRGEIDIAVHSFKDLPTADEPGIRLGAVPAREDPADVLCAAAGAGLDRLPAGARIGTGSPRRAAQLLRLRPDVHPVAIRGNVDTRLLAVSRGDVQAVVLARAGLARVGRLDAVTQTFAANEMLPAPGQGALAVECREDDAGMIESLAAIDDPASRAATRAERAVLAGLQAGCSAPVGALATVITAVGGTAGGPVSDAAGGTADSTAGGPAVGPAGGTVVLVTRVISTDGTAVREHRTSGPAARAADIGARAAEALLADGAGALLGTAT